MVNRSPPERALGVRLPPGLPIPDNTHFYPGKPYPKRKPSDGMAIRGLMVQADSRAMAEITPRGFAVRHWGSATCTLFGRNSTQTLEPNEEHSPVLSQYERTGHLPVV